MNKDRRLFRWTLTTGRYKRKYSQQRKEEFSPCQQIEQIGLKLRVVENGFEIHTHSIQILHADTQQRKEIHKVKSYRQIYFTGIYVTTILQI